MRLWLVCLGVLLTRKDLIHNALDLGLHIPSEGQNLKAWLSASTKFCPNDQHSPLAERSSALAV